MSNYNCLDELRMLQKWLNQYTLITRLDTKNWCRPINRGNTTNVVFNICLYINNVTSPNTNSLIYSNT